jgi:hypothetical protein
MNDDTEAGTSPEETESPYLGDYVAVARVFSATEAHVLKGCLIAAEVPARVADDHIVQANSFLTTAVGGVRVLVPSSCLARATDVIAEFQRGDFALAEGDDLPKPQTTPATVPLWNPDVAALWSMPFGPVFGGVIHVLNARAIGDVRLLRKAENWLILNILATLSVYAILFSTRVDTSVLRVASIMLAAAVFLWYFLAARSQSAYLLTHHGGRYRRKSWLVPVLLAMLLYGALSVVIEMVNALS